MGAISDNIINPETCKHFGVFFHLLKQKQSFFIEKSEKTFGLLLKFSYFCNQIHKTAEMGTKEKLRERFLRMPSDFTFDEMLRLLEGYGYEKSDKGRTSGSRVIFKNGDKRPIMLHKPHPGNIVKLYAMKQVYYELKEAGYIKKEERI